MIDSNAYYVFSYIFSGVKPRLIYKYDTLLNLIGTYIIPPNAMNFYSPIKFNNNEYFTSGFTYPDPIVIPPYKKFAIIKSTIEGVLLDSLQFGIVDSTNYPAFYDALCMQNGYLYFAGSVYYNSAIPPYGDNHPSNLYIAKVDTSLNIIWEKLIGGDAYYTAMNVIGTSDGGILMLASRNDITDNLNNLDVRLVKLDSNGNITWIKNIKPIELEIKIFPNPAHNTLNIVLSKNIFELNHNLKIYNNLGQKVMDVTTKTNEIKLDISNLRTGAYVLKIESKYGWSKSAKFIKN